MMTSANDFRNATAAIYRWLYSAQNAHGLAEQLRELDTLISSMKRHEAMRLIRRNAALEAERATALARANAWIDATA